MAPPHTLHFIPTPPQGRARSIRPHFSAHGLTPRTPPKPKPQAAPFNELPNELLLLIGKSLSQPKDVYALIRVSQRFAALLTKHLHKLACEDRLLSTTALFYAAAYGNEEFVRLLLQKGTQIRVLEHNNNIFSPRYETIHETPDECCEALFEFVLKEGVDLVLEYDHQQFAALRWAVVTEDKALLMLLLMGGADTRLRTYVWYGTGPLHAAVVKTKLVMVKFMLDNGFDIEAKDFLGHTALQIAVRNRVIDRPGQAMIMLLLSRGASVAALEKTVLHQVVQLRYWGSVIRLLIQKGVPVDARDDTGATALHVAAFLGHSDIIAGLLEEGADATLKDYDGNTPLNLAVKHQQKYVARALVIHNSRKMNVSDSE